MHLDLQLKMKEQQLNDVKQHIKKLNKNDKQVSNLLQQTLNVKLRYEEIIKNVIENEKSGNALTVKDIIHNTELTREVKIITMSK